MVNFGIAGQIGIGAPNQHNLPSRGFLRGRFCTRFDPLNSVVLWQA